MVVVVVVEVVGACPDRIDRCMQLATSWPNRLQNSFFNSTLQAQAYDMTTAVHQRTQQW